MNIADRIRAGIWGVLTADAMGVPHEFKRAHEIPAQLEMVMPPEYRKTYPRVPYATWSDDGSLTLALAASLGALGRFDAHDFGARMVDWFHKGHYTPDGKCYDIGNTTQEAIMKMARGTSALASGLNQETSNGNGSLMRTLPLALFHKGSDTELYQDAMMASAVTHAHPTSMTACGIYSVAARYLLSGETVPRSLVQGLKTASVPLTLPTTPTGTGFVLDTLTFAIRAVRSKRSYEETVLDAIRLGGDTDTTAAVAGGLVAIRDGLNAIPSPWISALHGRPLATEIIERLIQTRG